MVFKTFTCKKCALNVRSIPLISKLSKSCPLFCFRSYCVLIMTKRSLDDIHFSLHAFPVKSTNAHTHTHSHVHTHAHAHTLWTRLGQWPKNQRKLWWPSFLDENKDASCRKDSTDWSLREIKLLLGQECQPHWSHYLFSCSIHLSSHLKDMGRYQNLATRTFPYWLKACTDCTISSSLCHDFAIMGKCSGR